MSSSRKILVVNDHGPTYFEPFRYLGLECTRNHEAIEDPESLALVVFTGGSDVDPGMYDRTPHPRTSSSISRDMVETALCETARRNGIPMAGICRGAQLLCVMAGGRLVQDVTGHLYTHAVTAQYPSGKSELIDVSSSHHQMQYPFDLEDGKDYEVLAFSPKPRSLHYALDRETTILQSKATSQLKVEPDVVWYPQLKALAAQFHPEWMQEESSGFKYFRALVDHYLVPLMREDAAGRKKTA